MSRIGKMPIKIVQGVSISNIGSQVEIKGPKGVFGLVLPSDFILEQKEDVLTLVPKNGAEVSQKNIYGLFRTLLQNGVIGVTTGWQKTLELVGVGYRVLGDASEITMTIGFSHPVKFKAPEGITFKTIGNNKIEVSGIDKKLVGETAAKIRETSPPEPYKGKGIRYVGEIVRRKAGKAVKAVGTGG